MEGNILKIGSRGVPALSKVIFIPFLLGFSILFLVVGRSRAAITDLEVTIYAAPNLVVDSNVLSASTAQPEVATVVGRFCNKGSVALTDVAGYIGDYDAVTPANSVPGTYPAKMDVTIAGQFYSGTYQFSHLGGSADAVRVMGDIPAGECRYQYWSFTYPKTAFDGTSTIPAWGSSVKPEDDLFLDFEVWGRADGSVCGSVAQSCYGSHTMTMRNEISAMANKVKPNPSGHWFNTNASTVEIGETITTNGILYTLGNVRFGFDNNGDLAPDYNAWLQPIGDPTYDPSCFRLIEVSGVLTVTRSGGNPDLILPFSHGLNQQNDVPLLYFSDLPDDNTAVDGLVYYTFMALSGPCSIPLSPYQEVASGFDNEKFNGDYGTGLPSVGTFEPNFSLSKTGPGTIAENTTYTYNIPFQNTGTSSLGLSLNSGLGAGLVISDTVPAGLEYIGGTASTNSLPAGNSVTIYYSTDSGLSWSSTDPGTTTSSGPGSLLMIQWWLQEPLGAGESGEATFQARIPSGYLVGGGDPFVENCADSRLGGAAPFEASCKATMVSGTGTIGDFVWQDENGNGVPDAGESGINAVGLSLYWDKNGDGALDSGDVLVASQDTSGTTSPNYDFSGLPAGDYLVVVDSLDSDLPSGYTPTTDTVIAVALSTGQDYNDADFGFGPALQVLKTLVPSDASFPPDPAYEGERVTFTIELTNNLPGDGTSSGFCTYQLWPRTVPANAPPNSGSGNSAFFDPGNLAGAPDAAYATTDLANNDNFVGLGGYDAGGKSGSITKVELVTYLKETQNLQTGVTIDYQVYYGDATLGAVPTVQYGPTDFTDAIGTIYQLRTDITSLRSWIWSDFSGDLTELQIDVSKGPGSFSGNVGVDAAGFLVTTDQTCGSADTTILTLPLTDTYDADVLQFLSADPAQTSQSTSGSPPNTVGTINWSNLGPLYAGGTRTITVTFLALDPGSPLTTTNNAQVAGALFTNGRSANDDSDSADVQLRVSGSITGTIWADTSGTGWSGTTGYTTGDSFIPNVTVELHGCFDANTGLLILPGDATGNKHCADTQNNGVWSLVSSTTSGGDGGYSFDGLRDGFYNVVVDQTTLPTGFSTRSAETTSAGNGSGTNCPTCDGQWNDFLANMSTFNSIDNSAGSEAITDVSFGYVDDSGDGAVVGTVWDDQDGDGVLDASELGIQGVTVYLCAAAGACDGITNLGSTTTDVAGQFSFGDVAPGDYRIGVETGDLPGMSQTGDPDEGAATCTVCDSLTTTAFTVSANEVEGSYDFGYDGGLAIGDRIWADWDGDGVQDSGEEGINGVEVLLYRDFDGDGLVDAGDTLLASQTTSGDGGYNFIDLPGNGTTYIVVVNESTLPAGYVQTGDPDEGAAACTVCNGRSSETLAASSISDADFGYQPQGYASIGDRVWEDVDADGLQDPGESGINGVSVHLYQDQDGDGLLEAADALVATQVTAGDGSYDFAGLAAGNYIVVIDSGEFNAGGDLEGMALTTTTSPPFNASQISYQKSLGAGEDFDNADFGFATGSIGDLIWQDNNGDGIADADEPGISGVTVNLYEDSDNDGVFETFRGSDVTDASGNYLFSGLPAGNYLVQVDTSTLPGGGAGWTLTGDPDAASVPCSGADASPYDCNNDFRLDALASSSPNDVAPGLPLGRQMLSADFGYKPPGVLGDYVWIDSDNDGLRDSIEAGDSFTEPGIGFIAVSLCSDILCSTVVSTTTTESSGYYSFGNLADGLYYVQVDSGDADFPTGLSQTVDPDGTLDHQADAIVISGGQVVSIDTVPCVGCDLDIDFGYRFDGTGSINGTLWHDDDGGGHTGGTGDIDPAETIRYANVAVYLWQCGSGTCSDGDEVLVASTLSDASGNYSFTGLAAGTYAVSVNSGAASLSGLSATTPAAYQSAADPWVVLSAGGSEQRDFGFQSSMDMGDLPASYNLTEMVDNGPRHVIPGSGAVYLGAAVPDSEGNGQESATAAGDDSDTGTGDFNDDDGVVRASSWSNGPNGASIDVTAVCAGTCYLSGWVDWNSDGAFGSGERVLLDRAVTNGTQNIKFDVPAGVFGGAGMVTLNVRYRLYASSTSGFAQPTGMINNGEVEDYQWAFTPTAVTLISFEARAPVSSWPVLAFLLAGLAAYALLHRLRSKAMQ